MSSLEEQLALFEKEVLIAVSDSNNTTNNDKSKQKTNVSEASTPSKAQTLDDCKTNSEQKPIQSNLTTQVRLTGPVQAPVTTARTTGQPVNLNMKFVPHQIRMNHPIANFMRPSMPPFSMPIPPMQMQPPSIVIESGPTIYKNDSQNKKSSLSLASGESSAKKKKKTNETAKDVSSTNHSLVLKTMALPSDVELLAAKRQASKAYENSYLGQVMRGEKKMKRFVRTGGGQVWEDPSLAEWDPNDFRIFCGDLGNEVSDELLAKAFRKYPSFQKAKVVRDNRTNKSKGYGFVSFKHQDDFIRAIREMDGKYVGNRPIKLRKSNWRERNLEMVRKKDKEKKKLGLSL